MVTVKEHVTLATLRARRRVLGRELVRVNKQIGLAERAQARLEERIRLLEDKLRQAA